MGGSHKRRVRRHRHQGKQWVRFGPTAKPTHKSKSGRTGQVHTRNLRSRGERTRAPEPPKRSDIPPPPMPWAQVSVKLSP